MGMYDNVKYAADCPNCSAKLHDFQSKDGDCTLGFLDPVEVDNFYTICDECDEWVDFSVQVAVTRPDENTITRTLVSIDGPKVGK